MKKQIFMREAELKNKIAASIFDKFDTTEIIGEIDFAVRRRDATHCVSTFGDEYLLWAEVKPTATDIPVMLAQLVLTIGKAKTFNDKQPPPFLGCFDNTKIAFIRYANFHDIFNMNDFNWKAAPSNHETKEFKLVRSHIENIIEGCGAGDDVHQIYIFDFVKNAGELKQFIKENFIAGKTGTGKIQIDKNNFVNIYYRWLEAVKPSINVRWETARRKGIVDCDFYLADLLSQENKTLRDKLSVILKINHYELEREIDDDGLFGSKKAEFTDGQKAHNQFWAIYGRPPKEEYWDYIIERRDLLVPQDIRERKGSFFTPRIWVELSQRYLADAFGKNWQDEYYVWDCAAGTGNLLAGLTNKYNIWASTLDKQDVDVMKERIHNGANLLESHVFQFDFLNDDFDKLPSGLRKIINETPERLVIYINPPYAEADNRKGEGRTGVATSKIHEKYSDVMGYTKREISIQFLTRIYLEIPNCKIGEFSKLKALQAPRFSDFRMFFKAKLKKCFIVPADSFDNVKGQFPIGFKIWDTGIKTNFKYIKANAFNAENTLIGSKEIWNYDNKKLINDWVKTFRKSDLGSIATIIGVGSDFQNQRLVRFGEPNMRVPADNHNWQVTIGNLIETSIYFAIRKCLAPTWLNDRDQFLFPNNKWSHDIEFQNDCLAYTLFNNNISSRHGVNHWIPFTESEVNARDKFDSHFMASFIGGKIIQNGYSDLFKQEEDKLCLKREFSPHALEVFNAGRELWRYYHAQHGANVNAGYYDIREHFQGRDNSGRMNNTSADETYNQLIGELRAAMKALVSRIEPKIYEYEFLKR